MLVPCRIKLIYKHTIGHQSIVDLISGSVCSLHAQKWLDSDFLPISPSLLVKGYPAWGADDLLSKHHPDIASKVYFSK